MVAVGAEEFLRGGRDEGRYLTVSLLFFFGFRRWRTKKSSKAKETPCSHYSSLVLK